MARTLPLRIVHTTDNKRSPFVRPTERYRSSLSIISKFRSIGWLFSNCSNSAGATLWASTCFLFSSSQSNSISPGTPYIVSQRIYVQDWLHPLCVRVSYHALQPHIRGSADKQFSLLKGNPQHRSLQFKKIGDRHGEEIYSARVTLSHRALAFKRPYVFCGSGLATTKPMKTSSLRVRL